MTRVPRVILKSGNKYAISAGRLGLFECPHLHSYCSFGSARDIAKCPGFDKCQLRAVNSMVDRIWRSRNA